MSAAAWVQGVVAVLLVVPTVVDPIIERNLRILYGDPAATATSVPTPPGWFGLVPVALSAWLSAAAIGLHLARPLAHRLSVLGLFCTLGVTVAAFVLGTPTTVGAVTAPNDPRALPAVPEDLHTVLTLIAVSSAAAGLAMLLGLAALILLLTGAARRFFTTPGR